MSTRDKETVRAELVAAEAEMDRLGEILDQEDDTANHRAGARDEYDAAVGLWLKLRTEFRQVVSGK